jgi:hypothetical protein
MHLTCAITRDYGGDAAFFLDIRISPQPGLERVDTNQNLKSRAEARLVLLKLRMHMTGGSRNGGFDVTKEQVKKAHLVAVPAAAAAAAAATYVAHHLLNVR